ncbi:FecR family protein [Pedobacter sp. GR22-6]|uniref:FecR family protein n=1 Tax=Pedobacter sp. GR22-6 TaxID=3127957 RepID=UPI00307E67CE
MEKKDIKDILEQLPAESHNEQELRMAKLWLFQLNNKKRALVSESELDRSKSEVWQRLEARLVSGSPKVKLWPRIVTVAAAVALMVLGLYFFNYNRKTANNPADLIAQDIAPGKVGATLTLASGKQIRLTDAANGELANEAGITITKTADGQLVYEIAGSDTNPNNVNTLSTAKGETYQVRLPDGSMVELNAASKIKYPTSFAKLKNRSITLSGEAYFQVAKDKKHPFIVTTDNQEVTVLGTEFNIKAYDDDANIKTTLLEGSVKVSTVDNSNSYPRTLVPGQQSTYSSSEGISIKEVDTEEAVAWRNGFFIFDNENMETAMRKISRWYNVEIIFEQQELKKEIFGGSVSRSENITQLLRALSKAAKVNMKVEGKSIIISRTN